MSRTTLQTCKGIEVCGKKLLYSSSLSVSINLLKLLVKSYKSYIARVGRVVIAYH